MSKRNTRKIKRRLGKGKDSYVYACKEPDFVVQYTLNPYLQPARNLQAKLVKIDPEEKFFIHYRPETACTYNRKSSAKWKYKTIHVMKKVIPLVGLNREQYRHLNKAVTLLQDNNIAHLDLPNNVMMDPKDNMPRIIDWGESKMYASKKDAELGTSIDRNAFLRNYKIQK